jgi:transposase
MHMPKKLYVVTLTADERSSLQKLITTGKAAAQKRLHAQILLKADVGEGGDGWRDQQIMEAFGVGRSTVERVRQRLVEEGLESALTRKPRPKGLPRKIDGAVEAHLIATACSQAPEGRTRWTLRLLADRLVALELVDSISHETVRRVLKKTKSSRG